MPLALSLLLYNCYCTIVVMLYNVQPLHVAHFSLNFHGERSGSDSRAIGGEF